MEKITPIYKLEPKNKTTILLGIFSTLSLWLGLYIFGYFFNYKDHNFIPKNAVEGFDEKDYTISCSLSGGNKLGITIAFILGVILFLALIFLRFKRTFNSKNIFIFVDFNFSRFINIYDILQPL